MKRMKKKKKQQHPLVQLYLVRLWSLLFLPLILVFFFFIGSLAAVVPAWLELRTCPWLSSLDVSQRFLEQVEAGWQSGSGTANVRITGDNGFPLYNILYARDADTPY